MLTGWRLLRHCSKWSGRRYISPIHVYYLPRLRVSNVYKFNESNGFTLVKKKKKQKIPRTNYYRRGLRRLHSVSGKYTSLNRILATQSKTDSSWYRPPCQRRHNRNMCFNPRGDISTRNGGSLNLVYKFTYPGNCVINWKWHQLATSKGKDS